MINRSARGLEREPVHRTCLGPAGKRRPRARSWRARETRSARETGYFLFLRWIRVFFSSLRCFFFAIRLRRFLMTEPIRSPSLRHNGRRARHHSPAAGEAGHTPETREKRERQPFTQCSSVPATAPRLHEPCLLRRPAPPPVLGRRSQLRRYGGRPRWITARFRGCRTPTLRCPVPAKTSGQT